MKEPKTPKKIFCLRMSTAIREKIEKARDARKEYIPITLNNFILECALTYIDQEENKKK